MITKYTHALVVIAIIIAVLLVAGCISSPKTETSNKSNSTTKNIGTNQLFAPTELTDGSISQVINNSSFLVLDFYYPGCGPCESMNQTTLELSNELHGQIKFGRLNVKANRNTTQKFKATSYPTLLFFDEGVLVNRLKGDINKSDLLTNLKEFRPDLDTSKIQLQPTIVGIISLASFSESKPSMPMLLTDKNLDQAISKYPYLVVEAYAPWCEHCHFLNTTILELADELQGQVAFGLIDAENNNHSLKKRFNFTNYPTLLIYKDGKMIAMLIGNVEKSKFVAKLKDYDPELDTSEVKITQAPATTKLTAEQVCANTTKSDHPLMEAFVVSRCPFGLQMQRIMAEIVTQLPQTSDYLEVRYIGLINSSTIISMHGDDEAQENLRQICVREEQPDKYWNYVRCYMNDGKSDNCLKSVSLDQDKLEACINESGRGLSYAQKDFDLANKFNITGSPTLILNGKMVNEFDFADYSTSGRSPEAVKELLCCGFNSTPSFCSKRLNNTETMTMFTVQANNSMQGPC